MTDMQRNQSYSGGHFIVKLMSPLHIRLLIIYNNFIISACKLYLTGKN